MEYVRVEVDLDHPVGAVWGVVCGFGAIRAWIDGVEACILEGEGGVGSIRSVTRGGRVTRERLDLIDASRYRISYSLLPPYRLAAKDVRGHIELQVVSPSVTKMIWWSEAAEISGSPQDLAAFIGKFYRDSITRLADLLGHPAGP